MNSKPISVCLACGSDNINLALDLGQQPLANSYLESVDQVEDRFSLAVNLCSDCYHLQLTHEVNPEIIYKNYLYVSGTSKTLKEYSRWFAGFVLENSSRKTNNVLDIGCNDGSQLDCFKELGVNTYGIDPAENIYPASSQNHNVICDFFNQSSAAGLQVEFDSITAQNVFAHNPNPREFLETCKMLMTEDTKLFIQTSQANMVLNNEFDTIYHEHINFFNISSMNKLVRRSGLVLLDAIRTPIHGTSYVFIVGKTGNSSYRVENAIALEKQLNQKLTYEQWKTNVESNMGNLKSTLQSYRDQGYKLIGYGAAAKGNTLLNYIQTPLDLIIDDNPLKQGLFCPGTKTPIVSREILDSFNVNEKILFIPLAWNFFSEISNSIKSKRTSPNDLFLKYFPEVQIHV